MAAPKSLALAFAFFLTIVTTAMVILVYDLVFPPPPPAGLMGDYESPRAVAITRPGIDGPAVTSEGMIILRGRRCINSDKAIIVQQFASYRELPPVTAPGEEDIPDFGGSRFVLDGSYGNEVARAAGCVVQDLILALPAGVTPGRWYLDVLEIAVNTGELRRWTSEPFTVVGRGP